IVELFHPASNFNRRQDRRAVCPPTPDDTRRWTSQRTIAPSRSMGGLSLLRLPAAPPFFAIRPGASQPLFDQNVANVAAANSDRHERPRAGVVRLPIFGGPVVRVQQLAHPVTGSVCQRDFGVATADVGL